MIEVNDHQKGNNLLTYLTQSSWHYSTLTTDYQPQPQISILFLSLAFHISKPEYIHKRIKKIQHKIKILMIKVDTQNYENILPEMHSIAFLYDHNLVVCFGNEECARYINVFSKVDSKSAERLRNQKDGIDDFLKSFPKITIRDIENIRKAITDVKQLSKMKIEEMNVIDGIGISKCEKITEYFNMNFDDNCEN
ncbi:hypothetical protein COBT_002414 [Conglomerata obtusa]